MIDLSNIMFPFTCTVTISLEKRRVWSEIHLTCILFQVSDGQDGGRVVSSQAQIGPFHHLWGSEQGEREQDDDDDALGAKHTDGGKDAKERNQGGYLKNLRDFSKLTESAGKHTWISVKIQEGGGGVSDG